MTTELLHWDDIVKTLHEKVDGLSDNHKKRLDFELSEIEKQGANEYWLRLINEGKKFKSEGNDLLLPWLLGIVDDDPLVDDEIVLSSKARDVQKYMSAHKGDMPKGIIKDPDMPDIDIDCLPAARDPIKEYASEKYGSSVKDGYGSVCSVGTWTTYKLKSALEDVAEATTYVDKSVIYELKESLPDNVDELKDGGKSKCKGKIKTNQEVKECGCLHDKSVCPKCGSEETDHITLGKLLDEHERLREFYDEYPVVVDLAVGLIGRVRRMGMHAGALIIADRPLYGNIPMSKSAKQGYWLSMWTEGRNTQLSKFGYIKWDILGLKTLGYIFDCCRLIEKNRGIRFGEASGSATHAMSGWDDINPEENKAGHFFDIDGNKHIVDLNDKYALALANEQKTDGIFQFDTDLAKSILANGVRNFEDLMLFNAMGHPGPMASIPEAVANRDDEKGLWRKRLEDLHPAFLDVLGSTYGVICYQEQLQAIWQRIAGFTAPEAQDARKAVAKKWEHKLKPIEGKWIDGASKSIGKKAAIEWWGKMVSFGRYAFNRSHAVSYCLVAHRCLWLKAHFAPEFWAAVMSDCHAAKLVRYMGIARSEAWQPTEITKLGRVKEDRKKSGIHFDTTNIENLTANFTVTNNRINQGMTGIKGLGESAAAQFAGTGTFQNVDEFIDAKGGKDKKVLERFIKLGAFKHLPGHENAKATWTWYMYKYCTGKDITQLRHKIRQALLLKEGWTESAIQEERDRQAREYRKTYPKRTKIPKKIQNWKPKPNDSRENVMSLITKDFTLEELLGFEREYLGYYLHSPLDIYIRHGNRGIEQAKKAAERGDDVILEVVVVSVTEGLTKNGKKFGRMIVTDGVQQALVLLWEKEYEFHIESGLIEPGMGVSILAEYDNKRGTFCLPPREAVVKLQRL